MIDIARGGGKSDGIGSSELKYVTHHSLDSVSVLILIDKRRAGAICPECLGALRGFVVVNVGVVEMNMLEGSKMMG